MKSKQSENNSTRSVSQVSTLYSFEILDYGFDFTCCCCFLFGLNSEILLTRVHRDGLLLEVREVVVGDGGGGGSVVIKGVGRQY